MLLSNVFCKLSPSLAHTLSVACSYLPPDRADAMCDDDDINIFTGNFFFLNIAHKLPFYFSITLAHILCVCLNASLSPWQSHSFSRTLLKFNKHICLQIWSVGVHRCLLQVLWHRHVVSLSLCVCVCVWISISLCLWLHPPPPHSQRVAGLGSRNFMREMMILILLVNTSVVIHMHVCHSLTLSLSLLCVCVPPPLKRFGASELPGPGRISWGFCVWGLPFWFHISLSLSLRPLLFFLFMSLSLSTLSISAFS